MPGILKPNQINFLKRKSLFLSVFSSSKALVYFVPLLLADLLSEHDFGVLEYSLAGLGMIINSLINLGVPGAYPYFILKKKEISLEPSFSFHPLVLIVPFVLNQVLYLVFNYDISYYLALNISYIIANQMFYSTKLKSLEKSIYAVILDSGIYIVLFGYFAVSKISDVTLTLQAISNLVLVYSSVYLMFGVFQFIKQYSDFSIRNYYSILRFSVHLLMSTFLIFLITTSGRILVEYFFDFELVGIYSFYFRLSAVVVVIHQMVNVMYFKKIYTYNPLVVDKYYNLFYIGIYILSLASFLLIPKIAVHFSAFFRDTYIEYKSIYFLLTSQMVMWIATALNSNIIDREGLTKVNNKKFLVLIIVVSTFGYLFKESISFEYLVLIHFTVLFLASIIQIISLWSAKIKFLKSLIVLIFIYLITIVVYFLYFN